ncbi:uncharacterized protein LOC129004655 isoform X1 [Macrosteles quadrilineatus]|uniref:uncharacterized protein LOC129004655 isoform X1 n=2 Tax=Macrosteles quadrilineatus TaxID=74068 RepID=UPI0023E0B298|nr:uncharacterized protein LOC129004655 isoform X1 [Macrosteles quadrilineatus]
MISEETMELYDSVHEHSGLLPKSSPLTFSGFERNFYQETTEKELNISMSSRNGYSGSNASDDEESISLGSLTHSHTSKSSHSLTNLSEEGEISISPEKYCTSNVKSCGAFSFEQVKDISEEKIAKLKALQSKVNEAHANYRINKFVLDTIKTKSTSWAKQIKAVTQYFDIEEKVSLKCKDGEVIHLLGLEKEDLKPSTSRSMALINKSAFHNNCVKLVESNIAKLKLQKQTLQDEFGAHSMKAVAGILTREKKEQFGLYRDVEDLQNQVRQLISSSSSIVQQLATLRHDSSYHLQTATFDLLQKKAVYINTTISALKEKLDQCLFVDENVKEKMDLEGDNLKIQIAEMGTELKALQKTLKEYEKREAESVRYKDLIAEYGKLKKHLDLKRETLKLLDEPNMSF